MADRLTLTRAFEGAGLNAADAERIATEIYDAIHDNVATKTDVAAVRADLQQAVAAVRADLQQAVAELNRRIDAMVTRLGALVVVVAGLLFAALHYWPPHG